MYLFSFVTLLLLLLAAGVIVLVMSKSPPMNPYESDPRLQQAHQEAQYLAWGLIGEMIAWNRAKVEAGRKQGDLYGVLKREIDEARKTYDEQVGAEITQERDYLHEEIVNTLAKGNMTKLGETYPHKHLSHKA